MSEKRVRVTVPSKPATPDRPTGVHGSFRTPEIPGRLLPLSSEETTMTSGPARYTVLEAKAAPSRSTITSDAVYSRQVQQREALKKRWMAQVTVAEEYKALPRPPQLLARSMFMGDAYGRYVREKCVENVKQAIKKVQADTTRLQDDLAGAGVPDGGELRGDELRAFQSQWLTIVCCVGFLRLRALAMQHAALLNLRRLLAPKIRARYARKRRIQREQTVIQMFRHTMRDMDISFLKELPVFDTLDDVTLTAMLPLWTPRCFIDEFVLDERVGPEGCDDIFVLDNGEIEVTKRRVPTLEVIAQMFATKKYVATHGAVVPSLGAPAVRQSFSSPTTAPGGAALRHRSLDTPLSLSSPVVHPHSGSAFAALASAVAVEKVQQPTAAASDEGDSSTSLYARESSRHGRNSFRPPRTLKEALRDNVDVIGVLQKRGVVLGLLETLEAEPSFVGYRAAHGKRCLLWQLPRRVLLEALHKKPKTPAMGELMRRLRLEQLIMALPPTPQSLRNCDVNVVFRNWTDTALIELVRVLKPASFLPDEIVYDSSSAGMVVFIARGVGNMVITTSHALAGLVSSSTGVTGGQTLAHHNSHRVPNVPGKHTGKKAARPDSPTNNMQSSTSMAVLPNNSNTLGGVNTVAASSHTDLVSRTAQLAIGPWQCVGDVASLVAERRTVVVTARSKVDVWRCTKEEFASVVQSHPALLMDAFQGIREARCAELQQRGTGMLRTFLAAEPLFKGISERLMDELVAHAKPFWYPPHEYLCGKDASFLPSLSVILDGSAYIQRPSGASFTNAHQFVSEAVSSLMSAQLGAGTVLNAAAMLLEQPWVHSFTVRTRTVVEGYDITLDAFQRAVEAAFGKREDTAKQVVAKLRDAAATAAAQASHVPIVVYRP